MTLVQPKITYVTLLPDATGALQANVGEIWLLEPAKTYRQQTIATVGGAAKITQTEPFTGQQFHWANWPLALAQMVQVWEV